MEKFLKALKLDPRNGGDSFDEKTALAVYLAILNVPISSEQEKARQFQFLENINRIIHNYDEVMNILETNFNQKFKKRSQEYYQR